MTDRAYDVLHNMSNGFNGAGDPLSANGMQSRVDDMTEQLAKYKQGGNADPNVIQSVQSDIDHLTNLTQISAKREKAVLDEAQQRKTEATEDIQANAIREKGEQQRLTDASKPEGPGKPEQLLEGPIQAVIRSLALLPSCRPLA